VPDDIESEVSRLCGPKVRVLEFLRLGLTANYQLMIALAHLREGGTPTSRGGWRIRCLYVKKTPLTPGFAVPSPSERAVINCANAVNPNVQTRVRGPKVRA